MMRDSALWQYLITLRNLCRCIPVSVLLLSPLEVQSQEPEYDLEYGLGYIYGTPAAPELNLESLKGTRSRPLSGLSGRVVVVNFWATWCPPCIAELPTLSELQSKYDSEDLIVLGVNLGEETEVVEAFINAFEPVVTFPILLLSTPQQIEGWNIEVLPQTYIINKKGQIEYTALGPKDFVHPEILKRIQALVDRTD